MTKKWRREKVHVLVIEHRHGNDVYVCRAKRIADRKLDEYVRDWWGYEMGGEPMPEDPKKRLEQYFSEMGERLGQEFYTLRETKIWEK